MGRRGRKDRQSVRIKNIKAHHRSGQSRPGVDTLDGPLPLVQSGSPSDHPGTGASGCPMVSTSRLINSAPTARRSAIRLFSRARPRRTSSPLRGRASGSHPSPGIHFRKHSRPKQESASIMLPSSRVGPLPHATVSGLEHAMHPDADRAEPGETKELGLTITLAKIVTNGKRRNDPTLRAGVPPGRTRKSRADPNSFSVCVGEFRGWSRSPGTHDWVLLGGIGCQNSCVSWLRQ